MQKILIFSSAYYPLIGGAEISTQEITKRLSSDCAFFIITHWADKTSPKNEIQGGIQIYRLGFGTKLDRLLLFPFLAFWKGRQLHKRYQMDVFWSVMVSYAGIGGYFLKLFFPKIPFLLTLQEGDSPRHLRFGKMGLVGMWWRLLLAKADYVQAISSYLADRAVKYGVAKVAIVPNGVDFEHFSVVPEEKKINDYRRFFGLSSSDILLLTVSRLDKKNGVDLCIAALPHLDSTFKLMIAGSGQERKNLERLAEKLSVANRVIFVGTVSHQELPDYLHVAKIFIRPSRSEGLGNAFLEAMAAGLPVVGTPVGGIVDFLKDKSTGLLCRPEDPIDLAEKIRELQSDPDLRHSISARAVAMVRESYSWEAVAESMRKIFNDLSGSGK